MTQPPNTVNLNETEQGKPMLNDPVIVLALAAVGGLLAGFGIAALFLRAKNPDSKE